GAIRKKVHFKWGEELFRRHTSDCRVSLYRRQEDQRRRSGSLAQTDQIIEKIVPMQPILLYFLKMIGYSAVLMLYYYFFLRDKQYHQYNRYYLLFTVVLSLLLPMVSIPVFWNGAPSDASLYMQTIE